MIDHDITDISDKEAKEAYSNIAMTLYKWLEQEKDTMDWWYY